MKYEAMGQNLSQYQICTHQEIKIHEAPEDKIYLHTPNKLIGIGVILVMIPNPWTKILGLVSIGAGIGCEIYDQFQ